MKRAKAQLDAPEPGPELRSGVVHLRAITGLRFVAALAVWVAHLNLALYPASRPLPLGGPAVSFFFVLSGFILTWVYAGRLGRKGVKRFYVARWARIWPLHMVCLLVFLVLVRGVTGEGLETNGPANLAAVTTLTHSWIPVSNWYIGFNSVSWSISTEMFFYMAFPLLLAATFRGFLVRAGVVALVAFFTAAVVQWALVRGTLPDWLLPTYVSVACPLTRLFEFVLGMAACYRMRSRRQAVPRVAADPAGRRVTVRDTLLEAGVLVLMAGVWYAIWKGRIPAWVMNETPGGITFANWIRMAGAAPVYAAVICVFSQSRGLFSAVLGHRLAVWLGEISYAFYLIHQIILREMDGMRIPDWQFAALSFGLALFASAILYRVVEMPVRHGVVAAWDGQVRAGLRQMLAGLTSVFGSGMGRFQFVMLVALIVHACLAEPRDAEDKAIDAIVSATATEFRNVEFENEAVLLGFRITEWGGGLELELAWRPLPGQGRRRFLHISDDEGRIIAQGPGGRAAFSRAIAGKPFIERIVVRRRLYSGGGNLSVGFWAEDSGFARVTRHDGTPVHRKLVLASMDGGG